MTSFKGVLKFISLQQHLGTVWTVIFQNLKLCNFYKNMFYAFVKTIIVRKNLPFHKNYLSSHAN